MRSNVKIGLGNRPVWWAAAMSPQLRAIRAWTARLLASASCTASFCDNGPASSSRVVTARRSRCSGVRLSTRFPPVKRCALTLVSFRASSMPTEAQPARTAVVAMSAVERSARFMAGPSSLACPACRTSPAWTSRGLAKHRSVPDRRWTMPTPMRPARCLPWQGPAIRRAGGPFRWPPSRPRPARRRTGDSPRRRTGSPESRRLWRVARPRPDPRPRAWIRVERERQCRTLPQWQAQRPRKRVSANGLTMDETWKSSQVRE